MALSPSRSVCGYIKPRLWLCQWLLREIPNVRRAASSGVPHPSIPAQIAAPGSTPGEISRSATPCKPRRGAIRRLTVSKHWLPWFVPPRASGKAGRLLSDLIVNGRTSGSSAQARPGDIRPRPVPARAIHLTLEAIPIRAQNFPLATWPRLQTSRS